MMLKKTLYIIGGILSASIITMTSASAGGGEKMYEITVTNLTPGQPFAPIMAATHRSGILFFKSGDEPSDELAMLAEAGNGQPMADKLDAMQGVSDAQVSPTGLTFPGKSTTMKLSAKHGVDKISIGAMLGATNDAFLAIRNLPLPKGKHSVVYMANAYDAGSETNDELAATVAGLGGEGYSPDDSGEGFVHIHSGVQGVGDLATTMDWDNPVAEIVIKRVKHHY
jgi:hypothetical protein